VLGEIRKRLAEFNALRGQEANEPNPKVNEKIEALDTERRRLQEEVLSANHNQGKTNMDAITDHVEQWDDTSYENRQAVVDTLIKVIHIADGNIEITWNI